MFTIIIIVIVLIILFSNISNRTMETMVNITPISKDFTGVKWSRNKKCKYLMSKTLNKVLDKHGLQKNDKAYNVLLASVLNEEINNYFD